MALCEVAFKQASKVLLCLLCLPWPALAADQKVQATHALTLQGTPKYAQGFTHFAYANPQAPKGGEIKQASLGGFDSLNPFIMKGTPAAGINLIYDTLLVQSADEPFTSYGLLAQTIYRPQDNTWVEFELRPQARFHDGHPVTAEDVVFTFETLMRDGQPFYRAYYADIAKITAVSAQRVRFEFVNNQNRELAQIIGDVPILPKHYWENREFTRADLTPPLGSGPYQIASLDANRQIKYIRVNDYWGKDLNVNQGRHNFDYRTFDYYRDASVAFEAFKAGDLNFRVETSAKQWATAYEGQKEIIREQIAHHNSPGMQGFFYNTRKDLFKSVKVRQALAYAFDFEWVNANLFHSAYQRTLSYFANSELASQSTPTEAELNLLSPWRDTLPKEVFTQAFSLPINDASGNIRPRLRQALALLREAGWIIQNGKLVNNQGEQFSFELLLYDTQFERVAQPLRQNLQRLGIEMQIRVVDASQYISRLRDFDFDMLVASFPQSSSPGNEQREFWHSEYADKKNSRNYAGIKHPAVDALVEAIILAKDRQALITATRALDRVLLWQFYAIPHWHLPYYRVAYRAPLAHPQALPEYGLALDTWFVQP
ncbi:microcin C transport system substrate-binding protein [Allopseudospirillum japonicum]|uniref:Microcin C transport system substrate-binding protein n=1 Tax=Allopseudospirillum japonicum TaxID=64971 RepID=A0A1H6T617_9GAMM|nr:extracellular solute-binding protein [Allopseudospirillum japonicum]SEI75539.1 microcin C transport system substrate-binding protein [Allopseudospirillum japonicum]